ncbi:MAG: 30S ribosomal protein S8 [Patescibacteria group bacterium]|jgi:small subunit ribosomal protein S8
MHTDPISDFLTRLRNGQSAHLDVVKSPSSRMKFVIAKILEREGYVGEVSESADGAKKTIVVALKYDNRQPIIRNIKRISTPGRRVYRGADELPRVLSDIGIAIISTSAGVMTNKEARKRKLGGEVLCEIY